MCTCAEPVYVPSGNSDTVNAANYAPGEVGKSYTSNRKRYQIAVIDPELKPEKDAKAPEGTSVGPVLAGQVAFWKDRHGYIATNAPKGVIKEEEEDDDEEEPAPTAPTAKPAPAPGKAPAEPKTPPKATPPVKTRKLQIAGLIVGPFLTAVAPGNVVHLQQSGLAKVKLPEGVTIPEDSVVGATAQGTLGVVTKESGMAVGTTVGAVKDGFVVIDLDIRSAD